MCLINHIAFDVCPNGEHEFVSTEKPEYKICKHCSLVCVDLKNVKESVKS
jgi:hypothetical protein